MGGESYKIWGSALVALTVAFGIGVAINQVTHTDHLDIKAYVVDVPDGGDGITRYPQDGAGGIVTPEDMPDYEEPEDQGDK